MKKERKPSSGRREFLKAAGLGVGVAAVASKVLSADRASAQPARNERNDAGYSETKHVEKYYELARF